MRTVQDCLQKAGYRYNGYDGEVGIEIETEAKKPYDVPKSKTWNVVPDGSLRDFGMEYVTKGPLHRHDVPSSLKEFKDKTVTFNLIEDSISTSVHVHINMLNEKPIVLANYLCAYYLVENILIRYSGPDRLSNLFCLPITDAEGQLQTAIQILQAIGNKRYKNVSVDLNNCKYAAMNIAHISKLGTLEVRSFRGTTDILAIEKWVNLLLAIKDFAKQDGITPHVILDMYKNTRGEILHAIFGPHQREVNFADRIALIEGTKDKPYKNLYYAAKIASLSNKWDSEWGLPKPKKVYHELHKQELNDLSQERFKMDYDQLNFAYQLVIDEEYEQRVGAVRVIYDFEGEEE
jgi:hypothetical protein